MRALTFAIWGVVVVVAVALEALARRSTGDLVPLQRALVRLRSLTAGRVGLLIAWMWLGWHVFAR